ncbi:pullulanase-associated domain-containing protein [Acanthopleuribacter pedis]|uniref:Carbohydrate binding module family 25 domain-containing protein n=1 Tax=Acanthopleuribacter pedis TaxID=442870 RepID=A0A8J7QFG7_9BACT|nr:pullulanase-associated domain-containing protein [Acanthopleuribacter pedis]MBO1317470.1 hypothetical protein [Acanthopleuribacter pedis]
MLRVKYMDRHVGRLLSVLLFVLCCQTSFGQIAATHIYHNHMPNFWPYFDVARYAQMAPGTPIRYTYDGQVIDLKNNPPAGYSFFLPDGAPMPHDDLVAYYTHHAKTGAYLYWPWQTAQANGWAHPQSQTHVTMSASVINNVNSFMSTRNVPGYDNTDWGRPWRDVHFGQTTSGGERALDLIHFTGHHAMGPLVGNDYFLKDLIYHNVTLAQPYFLGSNFRSSKGFFPTELGFSERLIPTLNKLGIEWSVIGNVHFSRTLRDYPYLNDPGVDTLVSPPNRADLQNESNIGRWVSLPMFNEQQVTQNKFPFASIPHWVRYVDPATGAESRVAGIPVEQAASWEEGYQGSVTAGVLHNFVDEANQIGRTQYFVIAHDGDNSSGRAGSEETWLNSGRVTYSEGGVIGMGVDEYLRAYPIPDNDVVHVQDGSWIDTRDSSADPTWYHWHLPPGIWRGQFSLFNQVNGTNYAPKKNLDGVEDGMTVSLEYGYHYLERNFALLQAALNYAQTAEQIWLDQNPDHWSPTTALDREVTYPGNQLNPWMMSFPVKGDAANNYAGGANPAELAWYFLIASIDSGFGYYDENIDDHVKPTISFNQSLHFSEPYVNGLAAHDRTGPSLWWPQRWPYNPGSANNGKAEGWTLHYFDPTFAIYTYGFDLAGISDIHVKVRVHRDKRVDARDNTCRVYDPVAMQKQGVPNIDPDRVGPWQRFSMQKRDLTPDINGVAWQPTTRETMNIVPAQKIGDLYYTTFDQFRDQLLDYYIEAVDSMGNVTRSEIQQVYVGAGRYRRENGKLVEDVNGSIEGTYPFLTDQAPLRRATFYVADNGGTVDLQIRDENGSWQSQTLQTADGFEGYLTTDLAVRDQGDQFTARVRRNGGSWQPSNSGFTTGYGIWTITEDDTRYEGTPRCSDCSVTVYYRHGTNTPYLHYRSVDGAWTTAPGLAMQPAEVAGTSVITVAADGNDGIEVAFNNGAGQWDSNNGANYRFPVGTWTFDNGTISAGAPQPVGEQRITIHYQRNNGNTDGWGLHLWGEGVPATDWNAPLPFSGSDTFGGIATFTVADTTETINIIVHRGNEKDVDQDRAFQTLVATEIWLKQGDAQVYTSEPTGTQPVTSVRIHYYRPDGNAGDWGLHLWGHGLADSETETVVNGAPSTRWDNAKPFSGCDGFGVYADVQLSNATQPLNFIVHRGNEKDVNADRSFVPRDNPEVWLIQGDATIYTSQPNNL